MQNHGSGKLAVRGVGVGWLLCLLFMLSPSGRAETAAGPQPARYGIARSGYTSAEVCGRCHSAIYDGWARSMHSLALTDPVFQNAFRSAVERQGDQARQLCLTCHVPTIKVTGDLRTAQAISGESITCDFCHTISGVDLSAPYPFALAPGITKRGSRQGLVSPAHLTARAEFLARSEFCGGCHELKSRTGVALFATYSEWKASEYARRGIQCQDCHMGKLPKVAEVNPEIKQTNLLAPDHGIPGGHSQNRLQQAATVSLEARSQRGKVQVDVVVENVGAGHKIPTGLPTRQIVLQVRMTDQDGRLLGSSARTYRRAMVDSQGSPVNEVADIFTRAAAVSSDNRIAPGEKRPESFALPVSPDANLVNVEARLIYLSQTPLGTMEVEMARASRSVLAKVSALEFLRSLGWWVLAVVVLAVVGWWWYQLRHRS